jgi:cytochrome P450
MIMTAATTKNSHQAPGPKGLPVIGNTLQFTRDQLGFCTGAARDYGDVARFRVAVDDWYLLSNPKDIHDVCVTRAKLFHKPRISRQIWDLFLGKGVLVTDGDFWKQQHNMVKPGFHRRRIESYGESMAALASDMVDGWKDGQKVDYCDEMTSLTLAIVAKTLFDADVKRDARVVGDAMKIIQEALVAHINLPIPVPKWWPSKTNKKKLAAIGDMDGVLSRIIGERRANPGDRNDLLSMLLEAEDANGKRMSDKQLRDEVMTLFFAGHETTSHALMWTLYLLNENADVAQRVYDEVHPVLQGRTPTIEDLESFPYLEMVVKESMRLLPSVWMFMREPIEDVEIGGYTIPKGSYIAISPYVTHRHPKNFQNPLKFDPERFTPENEKKIAKGAYIPFSAGPRVCIGKAFAMMEARLILATIIDRVQVEVQHGYQPDFVAQLSLNARQGLPGTVRKRATKTDVVSAQSSSSSAQV